MGIINIPTCKMKKIIGILRLDDVLIVPNLDMRLFSVKSFLQKETKWVHFDKHNIQLGILNSPIIKILTT